MSKFIFILSISPVQSFISQARKTHDLYAGSKILSELIGSAFNKINSTFKSKSVEFIFPNKNRESNPNRLVCILDIEQEPEKFGDEIEKTIKKKLWGFYYNSVLNMKFSQSNTIGLNSKLFNKNKSTKSNLKKIKQNKFSLKIMDIINSKINKDKTNKLIKTQVDDFFQINWILQPIEDPKTYDSIYFETERLLGSIKNIRIFDQINEPANRKCSLCGERNAYFFHAKSSPAYSYENSYKINSPKIIHNEGLCAVCATKRFLNFNTRKEYNIFESTAEIALMETISKIKDKSLIESYLANFLEKDQDFQLYYKDNIDNRYLSKNNISYNNERWSFSGVSTPEKPLIGGFAPVPPETPEPSSEVFSSKNKNLNDIQKELDKIYESAKKLNLKFTKYYAILAFDGDNIGKILSGAYKKDDKKLLDFHKKLSECLNNFATKSKDIVESQSKGRVIYAGGDDFLGFININHIFDVMEDLRKEFDNIVVTGIKDFLKENNEKNITFSAGVVIAHYKMPLSQIVDITKELVADAKSAYKGKDAYVISVMKNSGEINKAYFKWKIKDDNLFTTNIMKELTYSLAKGEISNNFIKILNKELLNFEISFTNNSDKELKTNILKSELKRGIKKSSFGKDFDNLTSKLSSLFIGITENMESREKNGFNNFLSLLNIADFISREIN